MTFSRFHHPAPVDDGPPRIEVLFNVGDAASNGADGNRLAADMAAVLRYPPDAEAQWPLEALDDALRIFHEQSKGQVPRLYAVRGNSRVIGYLVMARDDALTADDLSDRFWQILEYEECAAHDDDGWQITQSTPLWAWAFWSDDDSDPIAVVAYEAPFGVELPVEAINHAISSLRGQAQWPADWPLLLYPFARGAETSLLSGVIIAPEMDDLADNLLIDDQLVHDIVARNQVQHTSEFPQFLQPRRYVS
jgi:hypothetical protein